MKLFVLMAYIWNPQAGSFDSYVVDSGISGENCVYSMQTLEPVFADNVTLACEFDGAFE